jgi:EmrB/QacA subfamily drug resistance transporter
MKNRLILLAACLSVFFEALDVSIVALALPAIKQSFSKSESSFEWLQTAYVLFYGGFLLLGGRLSDILGRKKIYLVGSFLFLFSSLAAGFCSTLESLIVMRCVQGLGAGLTIPAAISTITNLFTDDKKRNHALGLFSAFAALGFASGLMAGGLIVNYYHWHWIFWFNVPIIAIVIVIGFACFPKDVLRLNQRKDWLGGILLVSSLLAFTYAIHQFSVSPGWITILIAIASIILFFAFIKAERSHAEPLIDLKLFSNKFIIRSNIAGLLLGASFLSYVTLLSIYMQQTLLISSRNAGLILFPFSIGSAIVAGVFLPYFQKRSTVNNIAIFGYSSMILGCIFFITAIIFKLQPLLYLSIFCVNAVAISIIFPSITALGVQHANLNDHGMVAGLQATSYTVGCGIGLTLLWSILRILYQFKIVDTINDPLTGMIVISIFGLLAILNLKRST